MHQLVENRRLDYLLKEGDKVSLQSSLQLLTKRVAHVHTSLAELSTIDENRLQWGSFEQLRRKLEHNLVFIEPMLSISKKGRYDFYDWLEETLNSLKETLTRVFAQSQYSKYFEQRLRGHYIKRCHGDLKALNIWIAPYDLSLDDASGMYISILDVIDFNPIYSNIDILSDFAMLVVDIQARTHTPALAKQMIEEYLLLTHQQDEVARSILAYYLIEKALVGAIVNIIYDNWPTLGLDFLDLAKIYMQDLKSGISLPLASHSR